MTALIANTITMIVIGAVIAKMVTGSLSGKRAALEVRSLTGENLAAILGVITLVEIMTTSSTVATMVGISDNDVPSVLVAGALIATVGLAIAPRITLALISLLALAAFIIDVGIGHGPEAAVMLTVLVMLMLVMLSIVRGLSPVR